MKRMSVLLIVAMIALASAAIATEKNKTTEHTDANSALGKDSTQAMQAMQTTQSDTGDKIVVYYLHMNRRCQTCKKLEAYSHEALVDGFAKQLADSSIIWSVVNFEEKDNEHYGAHYKLYSQSLILSQVHNGKEIRWENLDKIWELVGHKNKYLSYVQSELSHFMSPSDEKSNNTKK